MLTEDEAGRRLRVAGATGTLEALIDQVTDDPESTLVRFAMQRERIEVAQGVGTPSVNLLGELTVRSAAVAPLRSQGVTMGALAVADRQGGPFTTEDLWLLSTVATNASVVLANSRLYEMVRRSKDEWETTFNALAEGIAVVGPWVTRSSRRTGRSSKLAEMPAADLVGRRFGEVLVGHRRGGVDVLIEAPLHRGRIARSPSSRGWSARSASSGSPRRRSPGRAGPGRGGDARRGRDRSAADGGAAHPERQDGVHRPAGLGCRA